jgi:hypothetical protein
MNQENTNEVFDASFRIISDLLDTNDLTSRLGIRPDYSHMKGQPNNRVTKSGKVIVGPVHKTGIWTINSELPESSSLEEHLTFLLETLEPMGDEVKKLSKEGYRVDFYCGCFFKAGTQGGFDLSPEILERMGRMGISLAVSSFEM